MGDLFLPGRLGFTVAGGQQRERNRGLGERQVFLELPQVPLPAPPALLVRCIMIDQQDALGPNMKSCR